MTKSERVAVIMAIGALLVLVWACFVEASPFLVCDPTSEDVTKYEIDVNGTIQPATLEDLGGGEVRIRHNWAGFSTGAYNVRARAGNIWGWSEWSDSLEFSKAVPSPVSGLGFEE